MSRDLSGAKGCVSGAINAEGIAISKFAWRLAKSMKINSADSKHLLQVIELRVHHPDAERVIPTLDNARYNHVKIVQ